LKIFSAVIDGSGNESQRPLQTLHNFVTRRVCAQCNNGWMSDLEKWFQYYMSELVKPEWPALSTERIKMALCNTPALTAWALKTATMINSSSMLNCIEDNEMSSALFQKQIVPGVFVDLAYIDQPAVTYTLSRGFRVTNGQREPTWQKRHDGKAYWCIIQLNHLAIHVFRCVGAEPFYGSFNRRLPLRVFPAPYDPEKLDFRFHTLTELEDCLYLTTDISRDDQSRILPRTF
jgi:hypothetical protein